MCTKVSTFYKGIDVSTGEVVSKFYEKESPKLSPIEHSVRYSSQPNGYQTARAVPAPTHLVTTTHEHTTRIPSPLKGTRAVAYAQRSARG